MSGSKSSSSRRGLAKLKGERALLASVVAQAQQDYIEGGEAYKASASLYFASDAYTYHLAELDQPAGTLPIGVDFGLSDLLQSVAYLVDKAGFAAVAQEQGLRPIIDLYEVTG